MLHIFIDADACPVKQEVYVVARRYRLEVTLVANTWMRIPDEPRIVLEVVEDGVEGRVVHSGGGLVRDGALRAVGQLARNNFGVDGVGDFDFALDTNQAQINQVVNIVVGKIARFRVACQYVTSAGRNVNPLGTLRALGT